MSGSDLGYHNPFAKPPRVAYDVREVLSMTDQPSPALYDAAELYDGLFDSHDFDVPCWVDAARAAGGPVLEAACGTGRLLLPIRKAGIEVEGFDASEPMVRRLREKAAAAGSAVRAEVADMRRFEMGRRYALIFCGFNGFAHCETTPDQLAFLRASLAHLEPGGVLALHMSYPGPAYWSEPEGQAVLEHEAPRPGGGKFQLWDNRRKDPVAQRQDSAVEIWELDASDRPTAVHKFSTVQRWVYPFELELLFAAAGFARWEILGGFDGRPLRGPDDQMIARAFKR
jgi:SAM-dependent methyltransferase